MNIKKTIENEAEKGRTLINCMGEVISPEKVEKDLIKLYSADVKAGKAKSISFDDYKEDYISSNFMSSNDIVEFISNFFKTPSASNNEDIPPAEKSPYVTY